jgi:predicted Fe-Mo cluster-binding NifX family protein
VMDNPHRAVDVAKGIRVAEWLVGQNVDHVVMKEDLSRKGPGYVLANAGIRSSLTTALRLEDAVEEVVRSVTQHPSVRLPGGSNGDGKNGVHPIE